jgi:hypothetical protein
MAEKAKKLRCALRESLDKVYACAAEQCDRASYIRGKILFIKINKLFDSFRITERNCHP